MNVYIDRVKNYCKAKRPVKYFSEIRNRKGEHVQREFCKNCRKIMNEMSSKVLFKSLGMAFLI